MSNPDWLTGPGLELYSEQQREQMRGAFDGAAGSTTESMEERIQKERLAYPPRQNLLGCADSSIDDVLFGYDMDNSKANDHLEDQLYSGFGTRSKHQSNPHDVANRATNHLTEQQLWGFSGVVGSDAIVNKPPTDPRFQDRVLGASVNGTQYVGRRARTTGAPQNHWFGPAGDPRGAGIGTPQAIQLVWSCHREVVSDHGEIPEGWTLPPPS